MRRTVVQLVVYLLLGVLINLTIAWGCAILLPGEGDWPTYEGSWASGEKAEEYLRRTLGKIHHIPEDYPASSSSERGFGWTRSQADVGHVYGGGMVSAGWPLRTLRGAVFVVGGPTGSEDVVHALLLPAGASERTLFPLHPLWLGMITNSLLYAGIPWFCARRATACRKSLRLRRGLCPGCGYAIGESLTCSECGVELPKSAVGKRSPSARG